MAEKKVERTPIVIDLLEGKRSFSFIITTFLGTNKRPASFQATTSCLHCGKNIKTKKKTEKILAEGDLIEAVHKHFKKKHNS